MLSRATRRMSNASLGLFGSSRGRFDSRGRGDSADSRTTSKDSQSTWDRRLGPSRAPLSGSNGSSGLQSFLGHWLAHTAATVWGP